MKTGEKPNLENESSKVEPTDSPRDATSGMYFDEETCQEEIAAWGHPFGRKTRPASQKSKKRLEQV